MLYVIGLLVIFVFAIRDGDNTPLVTLKPLTVVGPGNNNGNPLKAVRGSPTNINQRPLLNSSDQEVEGLLNKIRQSFGIRDSPSPPPYILRNGEMECKDYNSSCSNFQRDGLCVEYNIRLDCPLSCELCGCTDLLLQPLCSWFRDFGYCQKAINNPTYNRTKLWCLKTCGFCKPS